MQEINQAYDGPARRWMIRTKTRVLDEQRSIEVTLRVFVTTGQEERVTEVVVAARDIDGVGALAFTIRSTSSS